MPDSPNDNPNSSLKRPWWLKIPSGAVIIGALGLGALYVGFYLSVLSHSDKCKPYSGLNLLYDCLAKLEANAIGDALGGAFGPLAFIFLAAALIIQSMELAAQRYEIDETQSVMKAQLNVAHQQVEETRASTELLKRQTAILEQEHRFREQASADEALKHALESLPMNFVTFSIDYYRFILFTADERQAPIFFPKLTGHEKACPIGETDVGQSEWYRRQIGQQFNMQPDDDATLHIELRSFRNAVDAFLKVLREEHIELVDWSKQRKNVEHVIATLEEVLDFAKAASPGMQHRVKALRLLETLESAQMLAKSCDELQSTIMKKLIAIALIEKKSH